MRPSEYTPELLARWRAELPALEARLDEAKGNERGVIVSKVWIRKRALGMIPKEETLPEFRSRFYADRKEEKLARYREELPALREALARCKDGRQRHYLTSKIETREIALGLRDKAPHQRAERIDSMVWHMEHPDDYAPICVEREPGDRLSPCGWRTTANWQYVTCPRCLRMKEEAKESEEAGK